MLTCISIDVHGGDNGINTTVPACLDALTKFSDISLIFVGNSEQIKALLAKQNYVHLAKKYQDRYNITHSTQIIEMDEPLQSALRSKRDSSMRVALSLVKNNQAKACVSAGNSGALMAISRMVLKTIPGINRPAMFAKLPTISGGYTHMLDLGANIDSDAQALLSFAIMGSVVIQYTQNINKPSIALLNIGSEDIKGRQVIKDSAELLKNSSLNYVGFIEADTLYTKPVDVVVCDGYEGNLVLKASEGVAKIIKVYLRRAFHQNLWTKITAFLAISALKYFKKSLDPRVYNGASLLGLRGVVIKSHGGADRLAFLYAIAEARLEAQNEITAKIQQEITKRLS